MSQSIRVSLVVAVVIGATTFAAAQRARIDYEPSLLVQLEVGNLDRAIAFYTATLGFAVTERRDDLKFAHIQTNVPGVEFGLNEVAQPRGTGGLILNIGVADVDRTRKQLEGIGVGFVGETQVIPKKVKLAMFLDPDGNRLRLAGPPEMR